jgi:hypothetical protein
MKAPQVFNAATAKVGMVICEADWGYCSENDDGQWLDGAFLEVVEVDAERNLICLFNADSDDDNRWTREIEGWLQYSAVAA